MTKKNDDIQNIDVSKIKYGFGMPNNPEKDEDLIEFFKKAHNKEIPVYVADVYIEKIKPFCSYKPDQALLDNIKTRYLEYIQDGDPQYLHVYPKDNMFIMSDDYAAYYTYLDADLKTAPCIIFGECDNKYAINKKEIDWSLQGFTYK